MPKVMLTESAIKRLVEPSRGREPRALARGRRRAHGHRRELHHGRRMERPMSARPYPFTSPCAAATSPAASGGRMPRAPRCSPCTASPRPTAPGTTSPMRFPNGASSPPTCAAADARTSCPGPGRCATTPTTRRACSTRSASIRAFVVGHSMGAFVTVRFAAAHPDRVAGVVLVDGGLPIPHPEGGLAADEVAAAVLGPRWRGSRCASPTRPRTSTSGRRTPRSVPHGTPTSPTTSPTTLVGTPPELRSSSVAEAVAQNVLELDGSDGYADDLARAAPVDFLRAERGLLDQPEACTLRAGGGVRRTAAGAPRHRGRGCNHYTIVMTEDGAARVASVVALRLADADAAASVSPTLTRRSYDDTGQDRRIARRGGGRHPGWRVARRRRVRLCGIPMVLIQALLERGVGELAVVSNNCGVDDWGLGELLAEGRIRKMTCRTSARTRSSSGSTSGRARARAHPAGHARREAPRGRRGDRAFFTPDGRRHQVAEGGLPQKYAADGSIAIASARSPCRPSRCAARSTSSCSRRPSRPTSRSCTR